MKRKRNGGGREKNIGIMCRRTERWMMDRAMEELHDNTINS